MKKLVVLSLALVGLGLYACGGDGGGAVSTNPNDAATQFAHPTGTVTSSNATAVAKASLSAQKSGGVGSFGALKKNSTADFLSFSNKTLNSTDFAACITTSGTTSTTDWACAAPAYNSNCTGDGTTKATYNSDAKFTEIVYDGFKLNCTGSAAFDYACDGTFDISTDPANTGYTCADLACTINTFSFSFNGCTNPNGDNLISVGDASYVVTEMVTDTGCNVLTISIKDSTGAVTLSCNIVTSETSCTTATDVDTISGCTIN